MEKLKDIVLVVGLVTFFCLWIFQKPKEVIKYKTRTDTVTVVQTIRDTIREVIHKEKIRTDTVLLKVPGDTIYKWMEIPIEQKEFKTDYYHAKISGYKPSLDFIETYNRTITIHDVETVIKRQRWSIGVGVGVGTDGRKVFPYAGVGFYYNIFSF